MPRARDSIFAGLCACTFAFFLWGQRSKGSYVHVDVFLRGGRRIGEAVVFIFTTWSTIRDFAAAKAPLFSGLLGVCSGVQPFFSVACLLFLHLFRLHPRVARSRALRRRRRVALEMCAHLIKFERSMDASAYIFTVALRINSDAVGDGVHVAVRAYPSLGILVNEIGNLITVVLCLWALLAEALEADDDAAVADADEDDALAVDDREPHFWFTPRRPPRAALAHHHRPPRPQEPPSALVAALALGSLALLPAALCLPIFTMTNEEALAAFIPTRRRTFSVASLVAAPYATNATQNQQVALAYSAWFLFWFVLCPFVDAALLLGLVVQSRRTGHAHPNLRRVCSAIRACSSLEVMIAVLIAMAKELGAITAWIIRDAAPDAICDELSCFRVVATLEPLGTACLAAVVVAQIALYCHVIVTPRVAMGRKRRSLLRASLLSRQLTFDGDAGVA